MPPLLLVVVSAARHGLGQGLRHQTHAHRVGDDGPESVLRLLAGKCSRPQIHHVPTHHHQNPVTGQSADGPLTAIASHSVTLITGPTDEVPGLFGNI